MPLNRCGSVNARLSVWFSRVNAAPNSAAVDGQHFESTWIMSRQFLLAPHQIQGRTPLGTGLGQDQRQLREVERGEAHLAGDLGASSEDLEPSRDHQVNDEEQIALELPDQALAETAQANHGLAVSLIDRRIDGANEKRTREANPFEALIEDARPERVEVQLDVRKFRHGLLALMSAANPVSRGATTRPNRSVRAAPSARALQAPVRMNVSASAYERFRGIAELMRDVVRRRAIRGDAVEEVALVVRVLQRERHRHQHLLAEVEAVLPTGLP